MSEVHMATRLYALNAGLGELHTRNFIVKHLCHINALTKYDKVNM